MSVIEHDELSCPSRTRRPCQGDPSEDSLFCFAGSSIIITTNEEKTGGTWKKLRFRCCHRSPFFTVHVACPTLKLLRLSQFNMHAAYEIYPRRDERRDCTVLAEIPKGNFNVYFRDKPSELTKHSRAPGIYRRFNATEKTCTVHLS